MSPVRTHLIARLTASLAVGLLISFAPPSTADPELWNGGVAGREAGAPIRHEDRGPPSRPQRSGEGDNSQPVEMTCGPSEQDEHNDGPVSDWCANLPIEILQPEGSSSVMIEKESATTEITGPGPVNYEYTVTNASSIPLTNIMLFDNHVDAPVFCPFTALQPAEMGVCTASYTVTPTDINNGGSPVPGSEVLQNTVTVITAENATSTTFLAIPYNLGPPPADPLQLFPQSPDLGAVVFGSPASFQFSAAGGAPPYDFAGVGAPPGMAFSVGSNGLTLSGIPSALGEFALGVGVADSSNPENVVERTYTVTVVSPLTLSPPASTLPDAVIGQPYEFLFTIGGGQPPYEFSVSGVPPGMLLTQSGSSLRLAGSASMLGNYTVQIAVADSASPAQSVIQSYSLEVIQDMRLLPAGPILPDAVAGATYDALFNVEGGVPPFEVSFSGQPPGFEFLLDGRQLALSGVTDQTGDFVIDIAVNDASVPPQTAEGRYFLRVVPRLRLIPLETELPLGQFGEPYDFAFSSEGGLAPVSLQGSGAPPGMQFSMQNGQLVLAGVASEIGEYAVTVTAQDAASPQQVVSRDYLLSVVLRLEIEPEILPPASAGSDYLVLLSVRNGIPPYSFEIGGLPSGLSQSANAISGRPGQAGEFAITAMVTDASGNTGERGYFLQVLGSGDVVLEGGLPDAYLDVAYGYQLPAFGAPTPVSWSGDGGLPDGLRLTRTGLVTGYARQTGDFAFDASVSAADGQTYSGNFEIRVVPEAPVNAESTFPPGLVGEAYRSPTAVRGGSQPYQCELTEGLLPPGLILTGCNGGVSGVPAEAGSFPFRFGVIDSSTPELAAELQGVIRVSATTAIPDPQPPDLGFAPAYRIPVAETALQSPGAELPDESLQGLAIDTWGNRYIVGYSYNGNDYDMRIMKYSPGGVLLWDQSFDTGSQDYGHGIAVSEAGQAVYASGYTLVGNQYVAVLLRYDLVGVEQWAILHDDSSQVTALYGLTADEDGVYGVGERYNGLDFDALAVHYSAAGNLEWQSVSPGTSSRTAYAVIASSCGEAACLVMGGAEGTNGSAGWLETLDPESGNASPLASIAGGSVVSVVGSAAGFVAGGSTPGNDWIMTALGDSGQTLWSTTISSGHRLRGLAVGRDGYIYAAGSGNTGASADVGLISPAGEVLGQSTFQAGSAAAFHGVGVGPEGLVTAAGQSVAAAGNRFLLVNFNSGK